MPSPSAQPSRHLGCKTASCHADPLLDDLWDFWMSFFGGRIKKYKIWKKSSNWLVDHQILFFPGFVEVLVIFAAVNHGIFEVDLCPFAMMSTRGLREEWSQASGRMKSWGGAPNRGALYGMIWDEGRDDS